VKGLPILYFITLEISVKGKSTTEKMVTEAGKTLKLLKSSEVHILAYLFRNAHAIAKQNEFLIVFFPRSKLTKVALFAILWKISC
jgi:hypothetical protein